MPGKDKQRGNGEVDPSTNNALRGLPPDDEGGTDEQRRTLGDDDDVD
ncbi:MAG TPA: hypothetical protein VLG40_02925 [Candidatus Saccharimonas sp.]|nr:hypothetical protein [Candidatus Saccharimonas sp.]